MKSIKRRILLLTSIIALSLGTSQQVGAAASSEAELRAAMTWLVPSWDDGREQALQDSEAKRVGPGYYSTLQHIPGSSQAYTRNQINQQPPDWWPREHPLQPAIVSAGKGKAMPCAACHFADGSGTLANAALAGLPADYILEQLNAFRSHERLNSEMNDEAGALDGADFKQAADYFAGLKLNGRRTRIIEAASVPKSHVESWMFVPDKGDAVEPLGNRIVEIPESVDRAKLADSHVQFIAYVPTASLEAGKRIVLQGQGGIPSCVTCHGPALRGAGIIPPLAGRSAIYLTRQLVQFGIGDRKGAASAVMQQVVSGMTLKDMIATAAYAASLSP